MTSRNLYEPVQVQQYTETTLLVTFLLEIISATQENIIKIIIQDIPIQGIQNFKENFPAFSFLKKDFKSFHCLFVSLTKAIIPRSGTPNRVSLEESIKSVPNLKEALSNFDARSTTYLDKFIFFCSNAAKVLKYIFYKQCIIEEISLEYIANLENTNLIKNYINKLNLQTISRQVLFFAGKAN